jgi:hypothetical protein
VIRLILSWVSERPVVTPVFLFTAFANTLLHEINPNKDSTNENVFYSSSVFYFLVSQPEILFPEFVYIFKS